MKINKEQPSFQILICLIKIWDQADDKNPMNVPDNAMMITECENIEIEESYRKLIGTASVKLPRGTIIRKTVTQYNEKEAGTDGALEVSTSSSGAVEIIRKKVSEVAKTSNFKIGQRIRIYLGYTEDPEVARMAKSNNLDADSSIFLNKENRERYESASNLNDGEKANEAKRCLHIMFDGYITKISVDTPIEIYCENLANKLKQITCGKIKLNAHSTVNQLLLEEYTYKGQKKKGYNLLKGSGLTLHPKALQQHYDLAVGIIPDDLTVADVITEWAKYGLCAFVSQYDGKPVLCIGRTYFSNAKDDSVINAQTKITEPATILFDYNVAENGLSLTSTDKRYLAVKAEGLIDGNKFYHVTVAKNPSYNENDKSTGEPYRIIGEKNLSKKDMKILRASGSGKKFNQDLYTIISYHARKIPITRKELYEEAIKYLEGYNVNGIEGSLTLFGDLHLHTATKVHIIDKRFPGKNGYYLIDEVHTSFGTGGYRQTITLPYCIKRDNQDKNEQDQKQ